MYPGNREEMNTSSCSDMIDSELSCWSIAQLCRVSGTAGDSLPACLVELSDLI